MKPYWELDGNIICQGHVSEILKNIASKSVHMCVTSPPYYGLRNYDLPLQIWEPAGPMCADHLWHENWSGKVTSYKNKALSKYTGDDGSRVRKRHHLGDTCRKCGAWRGSLGLEPTPGLYVWHIVGMFREVERVLRDDGTLWLNMGDSYSGSGSSQVQKGRVGAIDGLPPKNLIGVPWMVAFALQADGWILRSEIIWEKPNTMPESAGDRPSRSHEQIFLFSKKQRYFYDKHAILEPYTDPLNRWGGEVMKHETEKHTKYFEMQGIGQSSILRAGRNMRPNKSGRNKRTIWRVPSRPFSGDHFAVFPPGIPEPCILAGTSEKGCCPECMAPWKRVVEEEFIPQQDVSAEKCARGSGNQKPMDQSNLWEGFPRGITISHTIGWQPTCLCNQDYLCGPLVDGQRQGAEYFTQADIAALQKVEKLQKVSIAPIPCTVLDPFFGSGTTGETALKHRRKFIGIDLSQAYLDEEAIPRIEAEMSQHKLPY